MFWGLSSSGMALLYLWSVCFPMASCLLEVVQYLFMQYVYLPE